MTSDLIWSEHGDGSPASLGLDVKTVCLCGWMLCPEMIPLNPCTRVVHIYCDVCLLVLLEYYVSEQLEYGGLRAHGVLGLVKNEKVTTPIFIRRASRPQVIVPPHSHCARCTCRSRFPSGIIDKLVVSLVLASAAAFWIERALVELAVLRDHDLCVWVNQHTHMHPIQQVATQAHMRPEAFATRRCQGDAQKNASPLRKRRASCPLMVADRIARTTTPS